MRTSLVDQRGAVFRAGTAPAAATGVRSSFALGGLASPLVRPPRTPCLLCGCSTTRGLDQDLDEPICWCDSCRDHGCVPDLHPAPGDSDPPPNESLYTQAPDAPNLPRWICSQPGCRVVAFAVGMGPHCPAHRNSHMVQRHPVALPEHAVHRHHHRNPRDDVDAGLTAEVEGRLAWAGLASSRAPSPPSVTCPICTEPVASTGRLMPSVAGSRAEQWAQKLRCQGDHRFCQDCLAGWITASLGSGHGLIRCPAEGCTAKMLPDDVERVSPVHRKRALELLGRNFESRAAEIAADPELHALLRSIAQQCPHCLLWIQKSAACNDMLCLCGASFCYSCGQEPCTCHSHGGPLVDNVYDWGYDPAHYVYDPVHNPRPQVIDGSCVHCGCSREFDADGERVCHCDSCREDGCHPSADHRVDHWSRFAEECRTRPYHPELNPRPLAYTGCLRCGCSSEFCPSARDRICGCDSCRETGCVDHADPPLPPPHFGCAVCGCSQEIDPVSGERVCYCDACQERGCSVQIGPREDGVMEPSEAWFRAADPGLAHGACTPTCTLAHDHRHWRSHLDDGCRRCGCSQEIDAASGERVCHCDACVATGCLGVTGADEAWNLAAANGLARWYDPVSGDRLCVHGAMVPHLCGEAGRPVHDPFHTTCCSRGCVDVDFAPTVVSWPRPPK